MAAAWRGAAFLGLWLVLSGAATSGLAFGLPTAALAAWASLRLLPPSERTLRPLPALRLGLGVLRASVSGGLDIARRAFDPRLPIRPGLVAVPLRLPPGSAREAFRLLASLQPGSLPAGLDPAGRLVVHTLDRDLPVEREMLEAEALLAAAIGRGATHA